MRMAPGFAAVLALAALPLPATAQDSPEASFSLSSANPFPDFRSPVRIHRGDGDRRHDRRGRRDRDRDVLIGGWYGGEWALYNNRSWQSDSYNDWWHDRTDRAFPRWMSRNEGCEKPWYSGNVLVC